MRATLRDILTRLSAGWPLLAVAVAAVALEANLRPGETVQPLDWTGGALHGMLIARAPVATRFIYAFQFYHDVDTPYIRGLRAEFVRRMREAPPRYIVDMGDYNTRITGVGSRPDFPELELLMRERYRVVYQGRGYAILERT